MEYEIKNQELTVRISDFGAELQSIRGKDGTEYLWQGDPAVWEDRAPNIFPYVARLTEGKYTWNGTEYPMQIHGFVKYRTLVPETIEGERITFKLTSDPETKEQYPFDFIYRITYELSEKELKIIVRVENTGKERIYFAIGGHPGFQVPLEEGLAFEDYHLEFDQDARPWRVGFSDTCFLTGQDASYPLKDNRILPLNHSLFDQDAIVLKHAARQVKLASDKGTKSVTVSYSDFPYLGIWHMPGMEAPYVCIEPWSSLPSRDGIIEDLSLQADMLWLDGGKTYETQWSVRVEG